MKLTISLFGLIFLTALCAMASDQATALDRAKLLKASLTSDPCKTALIHDYRRAEITALDAHHLLDIAPLPIDEAVAAMNQSAQSGARTGGKTFDIFPGPRGIFVKPLTEALEKLLLQEFEKRVRTPSDKPLYISVVGLGREVAEFPLLVEVIDSILSEGGISVDVLNLRIGLYDVDPATLQGADADYKALALQYSWLQDRVDVRFFDMSLPQFANTWANRELAVLFVRNSLRNVIVELGWPLVLESTRRFIPGGLLVVDWEAKEAIVGAGRIFRKAPPEVEAILPDLETVFQPAGGFGMKDSEYYSYMLRYIEDTYAKNVDDYLNDDEYELE